MISRSWVHRGAGRGPRRERERTQTDGATGGYWQVGPNRAADFLARGYLLRHFFPHRVYWLPKCGPDGFQLSGWMCGIDDPKRMWELVLYADDALLAEFPRELFFDDDLVWHQQQFGLPGQVATASIVMQGGILYSLTHVSDIVQRISRRREHKTRVEKVFKGWNHMLTNAVLHFALERRLKRVYLASADLAARHTDRRRQIDTTLFERIYDHTVSSLFSARRKGQWWVLDVRDVRDRIVIPERHLHNVRSPRTICICHDIERGLGHHDVDPAFAKAVTLPAQRALESMLKIEDQAGVSATYNVVGSLMEEVRPQIENDRRCVAFHSFDHRRARRDQLERCREVDYRIKGYRPPNSAITFELSDRNLLRRNFEWLAGAPWSLRCTRPKLPNGLVRLPIAFDDYPLHTGAMRWDDWEATAIGLIQRNDFAAIGLHDCYGDRWLPYYAEFLARLSDHAELRTMDEVAAAVTLQNAA